MKIRISYFLSLIMIASLIWACTEDKERKTTPKGYEFVYHNDAQTDVVEPDEYIFFNVIMRKGDSVISSTYNSNQTPRFKLPSGEQLKNNKSPIVDALSLLSPEDSITLYFPVDSMPRTPPGMKSGDVMEYDISVDKVVSSDEYNQQQQSQNEELEANKEKLQERLPEIKSTLAELMNNYKAGAVDNLQETGSGLEYVVIEEGEGPPAESGKTVSVHYFGSLMEADTLSMFDNSYERGKPFSFPLGQGRVIKGWDEGVAQLNEGSEAVLFVPPELGYGKKGSPPKIPGDAQLMFYVDVEDVQE